MLSCSSVVPNLLACEVCQCVGPLSMCVCPSLSLSPICGVCVCSWGTLSAGMCVLHCHCPPLAECVLWHSVCWRVKSVSLSDHCLCVCVLHCHCPPLAECVLWAHCLLACVSSIVTVPRWRSVFLGHTLCWRVCPPLSLSPVGRVCSWGTLSAGVCVLHCHCPPLSECVLWACEVCQPVRPLSMCVCPPLSLSPIGGVCSLGTLSAGMCVLHCHCPPLAECVLGALCLLACVSSIVTVPRWRSVFLGCTVCVHVR